LKLLAAWLSQARQVPESVFDEIDRRVGDEIAAGVEFAERAPYPDASEVTEDVYA
jgi:TPP-dependent pyruvate/acetoin dehydrogenase alpha subunit